MIDRRIMTMALVALTLISGCKDTEDATPVVDSEALEAKIREEVRAEIEAARARRVPPTGRAPITAGERAAIEAARVRLGAADEADTPEAGAEADEPTVVGQADPSKLTVEDRRAGADDPARGHRLPDPADLADAPPTDDDLPDAPEEAPEAPEANGASADMAANPERSDGATTLMAAGDGPQVRELTIALDIEDRQPVGASDHFEVVPERLSCFSIIASPDGPSTVTHRWRRGGRVVQEIVLNIGASPRWRTWSRQRIRPTWTGEWSCEVLNEAGDLLGVTRTVVGGAKADAP